MGNYGYLCDSEGHMEMSVDYVGPDPLNCQRLVPQEHPRMWSWIHRMSPRTYPVTPSFGHQFLTMVKIWTFRAIKPLVFPRNQPDALRERS